MFFNQLDQFHSFDPLKILKIIYDLLTGGTGSIDGFNSWLSSVSGVILFHVINFLARYAVFSILISIVFAIIVIIYLRRYVLLKDKILAKIAITDKESGDDINEEKVVNQKWQLVEKHINSEQEGDWKLGILEADIILGEMLDTMALPGESIGEKLKAVEKSDFDTIEQAWEAHKIRNAIAHEGSDFLITQREAKRIIGLYKQVFDEFEII